MTAYEKLLEQDDTDAEAHWGAVISRYGIEYVEDPVSKKRIPTCHRVQVTSILADADYLAAVENAPDNTSRDLYKQQAAEIAEIQKGILAISANEKPYDVFICYKETDENGQRTRDSALAQDVYYGLTSEGYKVFFSRITLEDKLGQAYEPYIFAALNSAKVMVVIGTKLEYFNAVWVKNEWSRYLSLMKSDRSRLLIPCYRGMDPYDLPDELSSLQSQDMGKIGFIQDLLRGIKKVLDAAKPKTETKVAERVVQGGSDTTVSAPGVQSLMDRTYLFMEDGDWNSAAEYLNRVLDIDPKYAPAYAAKTCVTFHLRKESALADTTFLYEDNGDWQKAVRFATAQQKAVYEGYITKVNERVAAQIRNYAYDCAVEMAVVPGADRGKLDSELDTYRNFCMRSDGNRADGSRRSSAAANESNFQNAVRTNEPGDVTEQALKTAATMFEKIKDEAAAKCAKQAIALAEQARQKKIYLQATAARKEQCNSPSGLETAAQMFISVSQYKDAKEQAQECIDKAEAIRDGWYRYAVSLMQCAGESSIMWAEAKIKLAKSELNGYRDIEQLRAQAAKQYDECKRQQEELAHRKAVRKKRIILLSGIAVLIVIFAFYTVTQVIIPGNNYKKAVQLRADGKYAEAVAAFTKLGSYQDAAAQIPATYYAEGKEKQVSGDWEGAVTAFGNAGSYSDAAAQITEIHYQHAAALAAKGDYAGAAALFISIKGYKDVDSLLANDPNLSAAARDAKFSVGNYVTFGTYPQTSSGTDSTPIEWLVIDRDGQKALLISRYALDAQPYNTSYEDMTWEECSLRTWLNGTFMNKAFSATEQSAILLTHVDNSGSQGYKWSTDGGNDTQDKIFLLSHAEANKYFDVTTDNDENTKSRVEPTAYAIENGAWTSSNNKTADGKAAVRWWLRSPGYDLNLAAGVYTDGSLFYTSVSSTSGSVRPALWVNLDSGIF